MYLHNRQKRDSGENLPECDNCLRRHKLRTRDNGIGLRVTGHGEYRSVSRYHARHISLRAPPMTKISYSTARAILAIMTQKFSDNRQTCCPIDNPSSRPVGYGKKKKPTGAETIIHNSKRDRLTRFYLDYRVSGPDIPNLHNALPTSGHQQLGIAGGVATERRDSIVGFVGDHGHAIEIGGIKYAQRIIRGDGGKTSRCRRRDGVNVILRR